MSHKIALGGAQFGLNYGISNKKGKLSNNTILSILNTACENNIDTIDTAKAYGNSEGMIGDCLNFISNKKWKIITKIKVSTK